MDIESNLRGTKRIWKQSFSIFFSVKWAVLHWSDVFASVSPKKAELAAASQKWKCDAWLELFYPTLAKNAKMGHQDYKTKIAFTYFLCYLGVNQDSCREMWTNNPTSSYLCFPVSVVRLHDAKANLFHRSVTIAHTSNGGRGFMKVRCDGFEQWRLESGGERRVWC